MVDGAGLLVGHAESPVTASLGGLDTGSAALLGLPSSPFFNRTAASPESALATLLCQATGAATEGAASRVVAASPSRAATGNENLAGKRHDRAMVAGSPEYPLEFLKASRKSPPVETEQLRFSDFKMENGFDRVRNRPGGLECPES